jgi:hypothetical protein
MGIRLSASANGGKRSLGAGIQLKRMGVSAGYPDIFIPLPTRHFHGCFFEMKRVRGGKVSDLQLEWLQYLRDNGYYAEVAEGFEQARDMFLEYIKDHPKAA